jgi:hypothetical protein
MNKNNTKYNPKNYNKNIKKELQDHLQIEIIKHTKDKNKKTKIIEIYPQILRNILTYPTNIKTLAYGMPKPKYTQKYLEKLKKDQKIDELIKCLKHQGEWFIFYNKKQKMKEQYLSASIIGLNEIKILSNQHNLDIKKIENKCELEQYYDIDITKYNYYPIIGNIIHKNIKHKKIDINIIEDTHSQNPKIKKEALKKIMYHELEKKMLNVIDNDIISSNYDLICNIFKQALDKYEKTIEYKIRQKYLQKEIG